jgi:hypothetical protein
MNKPNIRNEKIPDKEITARFSFLVKGDLVSLDTKIICLGCFFFHYLNAPSNEIIKTLFNLNLSWLDAMRARIVSGLFAKFD